MKKRLVSLALASAMLLSLAACGGSGTNDNNNSSNDGNSSSGGHTLTIQAWDASFNIPAIEAAAADYKANVDPEFELKITEVSGSGDIETAITTAGSAGNFSSLPDIVLFQDHNIQRYVADYPKAWTPVEGADINWNDFGAEKLSYSIIDGQHYGVPVDNGAVIAAYRVDLLEAAGHSIDELTGCTWDEFIAIGQDVYNTTGKYLLSMDGAGNDLIYMFMQAEGASQFKDGEPYMSENPVYVEIFTKICEMANKNVLYLANSWSDYTDQSIQGDMVAGVINGNWIIPTMQKVTENSGKWEITTLPTLKGGNGYASNGGSSLYITSNCKNVDLAKDFLAKTFGSSTATYDKALTDGGVISCYAPAGASDVYNQGVAFFNDQPIYSTIVEMGTHVAPIEQSDYHYRAREYAANEIINVTQQGKDITQAIADAEANLRFEMGL